MVVRFDALTAQCPGPGNGSAVPPRHLPPGGHLVHAKPTFPLGWKNPSLQRHASTDFEPMDSALVFSGHVRQLVEPVAPVYSVSEH